MSKHTPAPWVIGTRKDGSKWFSRGNPMKGAHYQSDIDATDADARLIAAAPDLLAACKDVNDWLMDPFTEADMANESFHPAFRKAFLSVRTAIRKATGQVTDQELPEPHHE